VLQFSKSSEALQEEGEEFGRAPYKSKTSKLKEENSEEAERILKYSRACIKLRDYQNFEIVDQHFMLENLAELILENNLPLNSVAFDLICTIIRSFTPENKKSYFNSLEKSMTRGVQRKKLFITFPEKEIEITSRERYYYGDFKYNEHILRIITGLIDQFTSATEMIGNPSDQMVGQDSRIRQPYPFIKNQNPKMEMTHQGNKMLNQQNQISNKTMQSSYQMNQTIHQANQMAQQMSQKPQLLQQKTLQAASSQATNQASQMYQQLNQQHPAFVPFQQFGTRGSTCQNTGIALPKPSISYDSLPGKNGEDNKLSRLIFPDLAQMHYQQFGQASMYGNQEFFSQSSGNSSQAASNASQLLQQKNNINTQWQSQSMQK